MIVEFPEYYLRLRIGDTSWRRVVRVVTWISRLQHHMDKSYVT